MNIDGAVYPTEEQILAQVLTDLRYGYIRAGLDINVAKGTEPYIRAKAFAARVAVAMANNQFALAQWSPLTATGQNLTDLASMFGVTRRGASSAAGNVIITCSSSTVTLPLAFLCTAPNGIQFQVSVATTVPSGGLVPVVASSTGENTNQVAGAIVTWNSAAVGTLTQTATVDSGGLDGGADEDDDEALRARLLQRLGFPAVGGNWSHIVELAEGASAGVEAAFVYPAVRGPSSFDVAVTADSSDRTLATTVVNQVAARIMAEMPGCEDLNCTSVSPEYVDVVIGIDAPLPVHAGGAGGGFRDAGPWPSDDETGAATLWGMVLATGPGTIDVGSTSLDRPVAGDHFGVWDCINETMLEYAVKSIAVLGGTSARITVEPASSASVTPIADMLSAGYTPRCSPGMENLVGYAETVRASIAKLGPGEKTASTDILPRGARKPSSDVSWPQKITSEILKDLSNQYPEIEDLAYHGRFATGTTTTQIGPSVASSTSGAPRILVLRNLSFRRIT